MQMATPVLNSLSNGKASNQVPGTGVKLAQLIKERFIKIYPIIYGFPWNSNIRSSFVQRQAVNKATATRVILSQLRNEIFPGLSPTTYGFKRNWNQRSGGDEVCQVFNKIEAEKGAQTESYQALAQIRSLNPNSHPGYNSLFVFGFGYTSCALGSYLKNDNHWKVSGTHRTDEKKLTVEQHGFVSYLFNSDNDGEELTSDGLWELQQASHWLISIPPVADFDRDPVLTTHVQDLRKAAEMGNVRWIGYLSSTGVYGDWQGDLVDEESDPRPVKQSAVARLASEKAWLSFGFEHGVPVHVFRLGGIYGPGRSAVDTTIRSGAPSEKQQFRHHRRYTSRIHVEDICQTLLASMDNPSGGRTYNVVDDEPAPRDEVFAYARYLLKKENVKFSVHRHQVDATSKDFNRTDVTVRIDEKRVSNKRIKEELHVQLLYPTYRCGLQAILEAVKMTRSL